MQLLLGVYIFFVAMILAAEIAGGVYAYVEKDNLIDTFTSTATKFIREQYKDSGNPDYSSWNYIMILVS